MKDPGSTLNRCETTGCRRIIADTLVACAEHRLLPRPLIAAYEREAAQ